MMQRFARATASGGKRASSALTMKSSTAAVATARDIAQKRGLTPEFYVGLDAASDTPFSDDDDPLTVIFPHGVAKKPGDVSFLLGRLRGETVTRVRLIFAPELREAITAAIPA